MDRLDIEPKYKKLAPYETIIVDVIVKITKPFAQKSTKHKETIFIKSDFFDQKVNVVLIPSLNMTANATGSTTPRDTSLQNSIRVNQPNKQSKARDQSREFNLGNQFQNSIESVDQTSPQFKNKHIQPSTLSLEKELQDKAQQVQDLSQQVRKLEIESQNAVSMYKQEVAKRQEIEDKLEQSGLYKDNEELLSKFKMLLREREPNLEQLMNLTLKKEKETQERKDSRILEILKIKDKQLEEIQNRTVAQESDYGKLAQMFQEQKRHIRELEEKEHQMIVEQQELETKMELSRSQLDNHVKGREYQRLLELEERLKEANDYIQKCQEELFKTQTEIQEKNQVESFFEEALQRYKDQLQTNSMTINSLQQELGTEKDLRIRQEEHLKTVMNQLNQMNNSTLQERNTQTQFMKQERDYIDRINRLQSDKQLLLEDVETFKIQHQEEQELLTELYERLCQLRGSAKSQKKQGKSIVQMLDDKIEELARVLKEMEQDNIELNQKQSLLTDKLKERETELQSIIEENEELQVKVSKKKKTQGRSVQTNIEMEDMDINEDSRERQDIVMSENEKLKKFLNDLEKRNHSLEYELDSKNQELMLLMRSANTPQYSHEQGKNSYSSEMNQSHLPIGSSVMQESQEQMISKLNGKITQLKMNEDKLQQEIRELRSYQAQTSKLENSSMIANRSSVAIEERISEYEIIMLDQRQQLLSLSDENLNLKHSITEMGRKNELQQEEMKIRLRNMSELKNKHEQINQMLSSSQTESGYFGQSQKSTAAETERMRQHVQQLELNQMYLKHQCEELKTTLKVTSNELCQVKQEMIRAEQSATKYKYEVQMAKVGLSSDQDNKLTQKVIEQRNKIKYLQGLLIRAKQDFEQSKNNQTSNGSNNQWTNNRNEDVQKTNERLRREHQKAILMIVDLKEEYTNKLMIFADKHESQNAKLKQENQALQRKIEHLSNQVTYMEKKEMRLFGQLEEARSLQEQETQEKETRTRELEELLFKKEETINELEREIKTKEKTIQDRQEQIAVLIGTLENERSSDESRQKLLNQTAELCSIKAIHAQTERKINEMIHTLKKSELNASKLSKQLELERLKNKESLTQVKKLEKANDTQQRQIQDLMIGQDEKEREVGELKFKNERHEFQMQLKEENVSQMREQIRRGENSFKEEVERIRKEFNEKINSSMVSSKNGKENIENKSLQFKTAVQQLHICIADFMNNSNESSEKQIIQEFEKALIVASNNIEKLQQDLDKQLKIQAIYHSDLKSTALTKILISKQENLQIKLQKLQSQYSTREDQRELYIKNQEYCWSKLIRDQDLKINTQTSMNTQLETEIKDLRDLYTHIKDQKEELEQSLIMFEQESENKKQAMERKAELTVDERFKSKDEVIKAYFDSNITRILLNTQNTTNDKILEQGREMVALKLLIEKLQSHMELAHSENQALEINLAHYKEQNQHQESRVREIQLKLNQTNSKLHHQDLQTKIELEKKKQEVIAIEKDLLKSREQIELKTREVIQVQDLLTKQELNQKGRTQSTDNEQQAFKEQQITQLKAHIEEIQEKLVESRAQNIHELEDLRVQYDLELTEQRRHLLKERESLEKRFMPGYAPGDLLENNQDLQNRIIELKAALDRIMQENAILRKKCENEKMSNESQRSELISYKQALLELESTMAEMTNGGFNQQASQMKEQRSKMSSNQEDKKKLKIGLRKKTNQLHFSKDAYQSESEQYSQSKINHQDQSSLNVSALTSVNMIPTSNIQRPSSSIAAYSSSNTQQRQFIINPPPLVKALIQAKINEMLLKRKCEDLIQVEVDLRSQIKDINTRMRENPSSQRKDYAASQNSDVDYEMDELRRRLIELEIENEDLKIHRAQEQVQQIKLQQQQTPMKPLQEIQQEYPIQDFNTMIEALIYLIQQMANDQNIQENQCIEEAQRVVIKCLSQKIMSDQGVNLDNLQYVPSEEKDRKLWYLELLEQQVNNSEQVINQLQSFIKKLQIDISGNLQSAAQIKAASMDLAQNTKKTSEEVKTLRHIVGLIKHDLNKNFQQQNQQQTNQRTINPFEKQNIQQSAYYDQLMQNTDQIQNKLVITEKVQKTLELEIVQLKINHAQELQSLTQRLSQAIDQRNSLLQTNEELHAKVETLQSSLDKLRNEIFSISEENSHNQTILYEKEREKQLLAQNKTATSKHLQKLQSDMHEWRAQTDENMKLKEKQIAEMNGQVTQLTTERDRLKSENQMLRRNEKERKINVNDDQKKLETENKQLIDRLNKEMNERKREIEYWVTERATMREMIDQLESEKVEVVMDNSNGKNNENSDQKVKAVKKKMSSKIKQKEIDLRHKEKQLQEISDELSKVKYSTTQLEQKIRESSSRQTEAEERVKYYSQKIKEVELERDLVLAEKNNALQSNDYSSAQIQVELNSLRECFAKLKVERDNLLYEMEATHTREQDWRSTVDKLTEELETMERNIIARERDQSETIKILETKSTTLLADLKYLKLENSKYKEKSKDLDQSQIQYEQKVHQEQMKNQEIAFQVEDHKRQYNDMKLALKGKEQMVKDLQGQLLIVEGSKMRDIQELKTKIDDIKEANAQIIALYENQISDLRIRFIQDKQKTEQQVDNMFSIAQRDAVVKNLKKEMIVSKASLNKVKAKNIELKALIQNQENIQNNQKQQRKTNLSKQSIKDFSTIQDEQLDKNIVKLAQILLSDEGYKGMFDQLQKSNSVMVSYVEMKADLEKINNWNMVISQQLQEQQETNQELQEQLEGYQKVTMKESKAQNKSMINNEITTKYKQELKQLQFEVDTMKEDWLPPIEVKNINEKLRESQIMIKQLKDEVQRKRDAINQFKQQRGQTEIEAGQIINEMEGLKDDNIKLQKLIRENNKNMNLVKELKSSNEYLKVSEKRMKEEILSQNEKLKQIKIDLGRKEQLIKEYKDKLDFIQDDINLSNQRITEIERLKEIIKKLKLDTEIKENQVKTLKQRLEHNDEEIDSLKTLTQSNINNSQSNQLESQIKVTKNKIRKYELYLKKSLEALRKIGKELSQQSSRMSVKNRSNVKYGKKSNDDPMQINEFEKDFYKDSVNILGVSMDELEEFMNPSLNHSMSDKNAENKNFMAKLEKVTDIPETLNQDIDQICNYCVKLINEINPDVSFK